LFNNIDKTKEYVVVVIKEGTKWENSAKFY